MISRYTNDSTALNGKVLKSATAVMRIRRAIKEGQVSLRTTTVLSGQRLDIIAAQVYGDGRLWWVIAAASNIGWSMQVPAGTRLVIPINISEIQGIV